MTGRLRWPMPTAGPSGAIMTYYDYEEIGGDCTNFASQCLFAGTGVMDYTPDFGWYYINANDKAPAWTGVEYFFTDYLTRQERTPGPAAGTDNCGRLMPGDMVQLSFGRMLFSHTAVVVDVAGPVTMENVLVAAHSYDADNRPLSTYSFRKSGSCISAGVSAG